MKPLISLRLGNLHYKAKLLDELFDVLTRQPGSLDEVWLCSEYGFPPMDVHEKSANAMIAAAERFRKAGIGVSLQISNSLGHGDYAKNRDYRGITWRRMVGADGTVMSYGNCPRDKVCLEYLRESSRLYALHKPDILFIDDDLRMHHHEPVKFACFCDGCVAEMNAQWNTSLTRDEIVVNVNKTSPEGAEWRERLVQFNGESRAVVTRAIAEGVKRSSPGTVGGLQHAGPDWCCYSGTTHNAVLDVLRDVFGKPPCVRPGGGFYDDHAPREMIHKALNISCQIAFLPEYVKNIRYENEDLPHSTLGKSPHGMVVESALCFAYGCNSLSYTSLGGENEPPAEREALLSRIAAWRPYFLRLAALSEKSEAGGLGLCLSPTHYKNSYGKPFDWANTGLIGVYDIAAAGLPIAYGKEENFRGFLLHPRAADGMDEDELRRLFSKGVVTCGDTINKLKQRGLERLTGITCELLDFKPACEMLTDDELNAGYAGRKWAPFIFSPGYSVYKLENKSAAHYRVISEYLRHNTELTGEAVKDGNSAIVAVTPPGGKIAVFGYDLWDSVINTARRAQLLAAADYVTNRQVPAYVATHSQTVCVPRIDPQGRLVSVTVLNASIDQTPALTLKARNTAGEHAMLIKPCTGDMPLRMNRMDGGYEVYLPALEPWNIFTVVFE